MPPTMNPAMVLLWIIGVPGGFAFLLGAVRFIFLIGDARKDLKTVVDYVHGRRSADQAIEVTLTLVENDITNLQEQANMPTHPWPDRRIGPKDRRSA